MTLEKLQLAGSVAALSVGVFVFASPNYAQTMTTSDTDAVVVAAAPATRQAAEDRSIRPFTVHVPQAEIDDLRLRIAATRWSDRETVTDRSQGVQLEKLQALVRYWGTDDDWRKAEAKLNALPQFITTIDGVDIFTPTGRTKVGVIWELSVKKIDDQTCEFTNTVHSSATPELSDFLGKQGIPWEVFQAARKPISAAHNRQETPGFAKSIVRHALKDK
jgi:Epoxide hydrolase N terminus